MWYDEILEVGNHYSNWTGVGTYAIPGTVGSVDLYPFNDIDQDNLGEYDEVVVFLTSPFNADSDFDGLEDGEEIDIYGTDALSADTDSDGMDDFWEVTYGTNPTTDDASEDLDEDDLTNLEEYNLGSLPDNNDTDSDGMPDGWEHLYNLDLFTNDSAEDPDGDNLTNLEEFNIGTMPNNNDTDGDTFLDGEEVIAGTDPLNASSFPIAGGAEYVGLILGLAFGFATIVGAVIFLNTNKGKAFWKGLLTKFKK